ncbi:hypothetical protein FKW77_009365 [Venturia effusa]|uniref:Uncharacterized protein n=1 Tax=Venturia effusa TaxID=50376 RepID=A0A517L024_9PEZI|nr:hypothetical protein FKW77_009365 [Venturia effusa]
MYLSSSAFVAVLPALSAALCPHHDMGPNVLDLEPPPYRLPMYEAPEILANPQEHMHVVTETITQTTQATTTLDLTTLPPLVSSTSISLYPTSSLSSSSEYHQDLKVKREHTPAPTPTPTGTQPPLFTGHGPVQPGYTFNIQGQSMTLLSGSLVGMNATGAKTAGAHASKATGKNAAGVVSMSVGVWGLWSAAMVLLRSM